MIYLIKSASHNQGKVFYKIGFTNNLEHRMKYYATSNPTVELIATINTYRKTKHQLETALHKELKSLGYKFKLVFNITTEWFECDSEIRLEQFKACYGRQIVYHNNEQEE